MSSVNDSVVSPPPRSPVVVPALCLLIGAQVVLAILTTLSRQLAWDRVLQETLASLCSALALRRLIEWEMQAGASSMEALDPLVARLADVAVYGRDFDLIAKFYTFARQPDKGIAFAVRAIKRAPSCVSCYTTLALLRYQNHEYKEALELQQRATDLIGETAAVPSAFLEILRLYERAVATANPGGA